MSWTMWHVNGIGFDTARATEEDVEKFLRNHLETLKKSERPEIQSIVEYLENTEDGSAEIEDIEELTLCYCLAEPISEVMDIETGLFFDCPGLTDEGEDFVIYCARYPWSMNETEKNLSYETLCETMKKYADELNVPLDSDTDLVYSG